MTKQITCSKCNERCQLLPMTDEVQMIPNASLMWMSKCCHAAVLVVTNPPPTPTHQD